MPARTFALLILTVLAAAGATVALWQASGLPALALALPALAGVALLWRRR
ncbi:MAG: hypothetical protein ACK4KW_07420 [Gemmobacter sp.]